MSQHVGLVVRGVEFIQVAVGNPGLRGFEWRG